MFHERKGKKSEIRQNTLSFGKTYNFGQIIKTSQNQEFVLSEELASPLKQLKLCFMNKKVKSRKTVFNLKF